MNEKYILAYLNQYLSRKYIKSFMGKGFKYSTIWIFPEIVNISGARVVLILFCNHHDTEYDQ